MSSSDKTTPGLTIDRAAFLLLRVKKAFRKKKQERKDKSGPAPECNKPEKKPAVRGAGGRPAPLLRSRTLPAIVAPGLNILQVQLDARYPRKPPAGLLEPGDDADAPGRAKRDSSVSHCGRLLAPRISFTDDGLGERRVSDTGPSCPRQSAFREASARSTGKLNSCGFAGSQPLTKLARLLNQRPSFVPPGDDVPRRLSWERRERASSSSCLPRSGSIDSVAEWSSLALDGGAAPPPVADVALLGARRLGEQPAQKRSSSPLLGSRSDRLSLASPGAGRKIKGQRTVLESQSSQAMEFLEGLGRRKALQRNLYQHGKLSSVNANSITIQSSCDIHLHVLFTAIEQGHIDRVKGILESTEIEINSLNADGLSTLDVAVLNNNRQLTKMLITFGAQEGNQCKSIYLRFVDPTSHCTANYTAKKIVKSPEGLKSHLTMLLAEAERRLQEVGGQVTCPGFSGTPLLEPSSSHSHRGSFSSQHANLAGCGGSAEEKQLASWERRARALKKMLVILEQMGLPDAPVLVTVDVTGTTSVTVKFHESDVAESPLCTKFKLEWSLTEDFSEVCGEEVVLDMKLRQCRVDNLAHGRKYFFRAATGNAKGYSQFKPTTPTYIIPSSWRDVDGRTARFDGRLEQLEQLLRDVRGAEFCLEGPALQRRNHKKKTTIKQLFTASSKFQKNLRRGVFLSCILYHEDRVLVTNEDFLPVIEIDETYPSLIQQDFHWLMKVACSWDDVKCLKQDMEKSQGSSTNHFRIKMLQAASQMQAALCIQDLGQFYHKPIRDVQGTLVLSSVNHVRSSKLVSLLNSKWLPMSKVGKKLSVHEESNVADILMASVQEQVRYHQASGLKLSRGLYLGYLKLQSSVDSIRVVVPAKSPNVLPHCKVRDNPHVSADEWQHLRRLGRREATEQASEQQSAFADALAGAARRLFGYMDMGADEPLSHRIYSAEVVELSAEVSLLVMVPPSESACSPPGSNRELLLKRTDILCLPIQVFEMIHLGTYQRELSSRYFRLSCILELDTARAQHSHREAFSASELSVARERLDRLKDVQARANAAWKAARWLVDLITFARDKTSAGASVRYLASSERQSGSLKRSLLQLPPRDPKLVKASPGRGSWPGPTAGADTTGGTGLGLLGAESLSKSEQQLPLAESAAASRRASGTSQNSTASESGRAASASGSRRGPAAAPGSRLPPSRSEDVLAPGRARHAEHPNASVSAASSPLLGLQPVARSASGATSGSALSVSSDEWPPSRRPAASLAARPEAEGPREEGAPPPGILQVFAAYETGLASGTSLKLHVTPRTTAREVVDLVVRQLNMAVLLKGLEGPVYAPDELVNFCLVAVIGARERCLRDDFKPLQLQNPWKKGRLYVRQKQDVLAALEHSSKHSAYL
ncbi:LOW QUALITY PROTEIN: ankyrin repeat and fibronectin type-III domain-containing protein 1 [Phymastichus coffea]|uniref:LOW QUALITY PROTEIN: ankyrin repeat and fibronectin type-III domain-containing protein 1 n=1 Tax=Phymastichus coffea TaxID=108790 RepID=UPI00273B02B7|nr:LOW QUALITY PROTEIN: ankyrin repeat and fibronectin type-III domain-containing protein 1 [Phymastichus coffea]